ncbi:MAG: SDR family NAD(P)-dependent oxidoreductase, partial [Acidobacteriota bacterium]|nr:SDR family NAD(P)-dependent oxidoreductase [Acidobacteriota bacterium]
VTGAASGIGLAVCRKAAAEGMRVVMADVEEPALESAADDLAGDGAEVLPGVTDVSEAASVTALRDAAVERFGTVHLVHNNAGVSASGPVWSVPEEDWRWVIGVNLFGVVHGIRAFVPLLVDQGEGHVVNTGSLAGLLTPPFMGVYNATKHAVVAISETLHKDLQVAGSPVGVSVLCPGFVRTGIGHSERNRPSWAPATATDGGPLLDMGRQLVAAGIDPSVVAGAVFDAVRDDRFYIFTHPETKPAVAVRAKDILEERQPTVNPLG